MKKAQRFGVGPFGSGEILDVALVVIVAGDGEVSLKKLSVV